MSTAMKAVARAVVCVALVGVILVRAKQVAPLPAPILNAKKVFFANAGTDALISALDQGKGTGDKYYKKFHAAIKDQEGLRTDTPGYHHSNLGKLLRIPGKGPQTRATLARLSLRN